MDEYNPDHITEDFSHEVEVEPGTEHRYFNRELSWLGFNERSQGPATSRCGDAIGGRNDAKPAACRRFGTRQCLDG